MRAATSGNGAGAIPVSLHIELTVFVVEVPKPQRKSCISPGQTAGLMGESVLMHRAGLI